MQTAEFQKNFRFRSVTEARVDGRQPELEHAGAFPSFPRLVRSAIRWHPAPMNFPTTHWSVLAQATMNGDAAGREALGSLCQAYWRPVADFLQHRGWSEADAEDLTQEFFRSLLESRGWHAADRARGKFRNFLLGALMRVLNQAKDHAHALKRGGGQLVASLDELAEKGFEPEDFGGEFPHGKARDAFSLIFDQAWAEQVMEGAMEAVAEAWEAAGKGDAFSVLLPFLPVEGGFRPAAETVRLSKTAEGFKDGEGLDERDAEDQLAGEVKGADSGGGKSYELAARALNLSVGAVKSRILRLRQEFREALERQIAKTVSAPHEIAEEMAYLREVLAAPGLVRR